MKIRRRHNTEIVLSYLFNEGILEHFGSWKKVSLQEDKDGNKVLCIKGYKSYNISKKGEKIYLPMDISFFYFIKLCEAMSKEQIVGLIASNTLTGLKQKEVWKKGAGNKHERKN